MEPTVKVLIFKGTKEWLLRRFGDEGYEAFLQELPGEDRETWAESSFLVSSKWPASMYRNMRTAIVSLWGEEEPDIVEKAAGEVAIADLSTVFKVAMKVGSPSFVAQRFPRMYRHYFSAGELSISHIDSKNLRLRLVGAEAYGIGGCEGVTGWGKAALKYAGAKDLEFQHTECIFKFGTKCAYEFKWS